jgi:hypothetical protein
VIRQTEMHKATIVPGTEINAFVIEIEAVFKKMVERVNKYGYCGMKNPILLSQNLW